MEWVPDMYSSEQIGGYNTSSITPDDLLISQDKMRGLGHSDHIHLFSHICVYEIGGLYFLNHWATLAVAVC